jgi:hypothetical protein
MNKSNPTKRNIAGLFCLALMLMISAAKGQTPSITVLGSLPPVPGASDQYQTNYVPAQINPPPAGGGSGQIDYYLDHDPAPGETFTTGTSPNGYVLNTLTLYDADNSGGGFGAQTFTLGIYSVSGSTATLLTTYTSQTVALADFTWFQWTNLGAILQPSTQYAYAMWRNGGGWCSLGNTNVSYAGGQLASVPHAGGAMTFSTSSPWSACFDVGLTPITKPVVGLPVFSPYSIALPGSTVTASAPVTGPGPYYFQWQTDGGSGGALTNIPGDTSSNLVINTTGFALGEYQYDLVVSNSNSSAVGQIATLTIQQPTEIPGVIAVKFGFTNGYATSDALYPADNTGAQTGQPVPPSNLPLTAVGNWNNLLANVLPPQDNPARAAAINQTWNIAQDTAGNPLSGVTLTPSGFDDGWFSGGTECAAGRLLYDFWKFNTSNGQTDGAGKSYATLTFNNLPGTSYDVFVYINDNNGNYWANMQANDVVGQGGDNVDDTSFGFNGGSADPCDLPVPLHTYSGFNGGNAANNCNYLELRNVVVSGGNLVVTAVLFGGGDMGLSGVELVPLPDIVLVQDTVPNYAETVAGEQVVFSTAFTNTPAVKLEWHAISGQTTNILTTGVVNTTNNGVVSSTLTLNNVALSSAGTYQVKAINANNNNDYSFSSPVELVVSNAVPVANNIVVYDDAQAGANFYPMWTLETNADLIFDSVVDGSGNPGTATSGPGNFGVDSCDPDPSILTDGTLSDVRSMMVACGSQGGTGQSMTYFLQTNTSPLGFELTNIVVYGGWSDAGRRDQEYQVLYSTISAPGIMIPLLSTHYLPGDPNGSAIATRTSLVASNGVLAHNVYALEINWNINPQYLNGYAGYSEIFLAGTNSTKLAGLPPVLIQDIVPQSASDVVGGQIIMSASFTNAATVQWIQNGTNVNTGVVTATTGGIETSTLTLNNLTLGNAGNYWVVGSNAVSSITSATNTVTVSPAPAPVNNVLVAMAAQTDGNEPVFVPTWSSAALASSLLFNVPPAASGNGDFTGTFDGNGDGASDPSILTDGSFGQVDKNLTGTHSSFSVIGYDARAGNFVSYDLSGSTNGYTLTNITVYGGWNDNGRDGQAYTISYSTVDNTNLVPLASVNYLPANPNAYYCTTRATITPASGVLAANVATLYFDFTTPTSPGGENGFEGYSEISVFGSASSPLAVAPKFGTITRSGANLIVTGSGGYPPNSGYTWLSTTNLAPPVNWITNSAGTLDENGAFTNSVPINPSQPEAFFRLRIP